MGHLRQERRVGLEFSVGGKFGRASLQYAQCLADFFHACVAGRTLGRKRQHRYARFRIEQCACILRRRPRDFGELFGFGSGTTAQSAKSSIPAAPKSNPARWGMTMTKKLETSFASGARPIACSAARTVSEVVLPAPPTVPSASPAATAKAAKYRGRRPVSRASSSDTPRARRRSW